MTVLPRTLHAVADRQKMSASDITGISLPFPKAEMAKLSGLSGGAVLLRLVDPGSRDLSTSNLDPKIMCVMVSDERDGSFLFSFGQRQLSGSTARKD